MSVISILTNQVAAFAVVKPNDSLETALALMNSHDVGSVLVLNDAGHLQGIIVERDILKAIDRAKSSGLQLQVKDVVSREVPTCSLNDTEDMLMERMVRNNTQYLPVVNGTTVFGMISISEVVKMRLKKNNAPSLEHFTRHLKPRQQYA